MKKLMIILFFLASTTFVTAQVDRTTENDESIQDKIQQEPPVPAQTNLERNARIEMQRLENEKMAKKKERKLARKLAKEKSKQTR
jgi:hypothetical protein